MDPILLTFKIFFPILFGIISIFFLVIALRGIFTRRPFLVSSRWLLCLVFISIIPAIILYIFLPITSSFLLRWFTPVLFTVILVMMYIMVKGFSAFGVSDITFREALITTLNKLQLSHEESLSSIRLSSVEADLQVSIHSWIGTGMIKVKQREHRALLTQIVSEMNSHFRMSSTPSNLTPCILYMILGMLMLGGGIGLVIL